MTITRTATADSRDAGRNVVHTVYVNGVAVATRRSAHRYSFAICRWVGDTDARTVVVDRWSRNATASKSKRQFAVRIDAAQVSA